MSKDDLRQEGGSVKEANEKKINKWLWQESGKVENIEHDEKTSQGEDDNMAYDVVANDDMTW